MTDVTEAQLERAEARGQKMLETEPRAIVARYEPATGCVIVDLTNGCTYAFLTQLVHDLEGRCPEALAGIEVDGLGFNLHWPALDVDLYVPSLLLEISGTRDG